MCAPSVNIRQKPKLCEFENKKPTHFIIFTYIKLLPSRQGIFPELCIFSRFRRDTRNATPAAIPASDKPKRRPDTVKPVKINVRQRPSRRTKTTRKSLQYAEYAPDLLTQPYLRTRDLNKVLKKRYQPQGRLL
jgi:hypothetical protein